MTLTESMLFLIFLLDYQSDRLIVKKLTPNLKSYCEVCIACNHYSDYYYVA